MSRSSAKRTISSTPYSSHHRLVDMLGVGGSDGRGGSGSGERDEERVEEKSSGGSSDSEDSRGRYSRRPILCSRFSDTTRGEESDRSFSIDTRRSNSLQSIQHETYSSTIMSSTSNPPAILPSRPSTTSADSNGVSEAGTVRPDYAAARMKSFGTQTAISEEGIEVPIVDTRPGRMNGM